MKKEVINEVEAVSRKGAKPQRKESGKKREAESKALTTEGTEKSQRVSRKDAEAQRC
jgi:hypothetical protein